MFFPPLSFVFVPRSRFCSSEDSLYLWEFLRLRVRMRPFFEVVIYEKICREKFAGRPDWKESCAWGDRGSAARYVLRSVSGKKTSHLKSFTSTGGQVCRVNVWRLHNHRFPPELSFLVGLFFTNSKPLESIRKLDGVREFKRVKRKIQPQEKYK